MMATSLDPQVLQEIPSFPETEHCLICYDDLKKETVVGHAATAEVTHLIHRSCLKKWAETANRISCPCTKELIDPQNLLDFEPLPATRHTAQELLDRAALELVEMAEQQDPIKPTQVVLEILRHVKEHAKGLLFVGAIGFMSGVVEKMIFS